MSVTAPTVRAARTGDFESLAALFKRSGSPCYCRYWHFAGDKNAWLDRCANAPADNAKDLQRNFVEQTEQAQGIVAIDAEESVVGWMKLTPRSAVPKIYDQRLYRGLPCLDPAEAHVWTIGCFLLDEAHRGTELGRALIRTGLEVARQAGARSVQAFPRRAEALAPEEKWTGSFSALCHEGFVVVHDFGPYPVVRCELVTKS